VGVPTLLVYDFGVYFLGYLRGVGASASSIIELLFDYISIIIFYTRIIVQGVRIVLMLFTYIGFHDTILYFSYIYCYASNDFTIGIVDDINQT